MKIKILSDLHLEFHADCGIKFLQDLPTDDAEVLVIAGDLATKNILDSAFKILTEKFKHIIYIIGNHELYHYSYNIISNEINSLIKKYNNIYWLDNECKEINNVIFAGTTLWFKESQELHWYKREINDFLLIKNFEPWVYEQNKKSIEFLNNIGDSNKHIDCVITHHMPLKESIHSTYKGSPINGFFCCDIPEIMYKINPKYIIHGHTHKKFDYMFKNSRVLANPLEYPQENHYAFNQNLVIEI